MMRKTLEQQIGPIVDELKREVSVVNPFHLMSLLSATDILSNSIPGGKAALPDGFSQKFHYINGLAVSIGHSTNQQYIAEERLPRIGKLTDTLFHTYAALWGERQDIKRLEELYDTHKINSGFVSFVRPLFEPKLGSTEQHLQFTREQCEHFDSRFFVPELGLSTQQILDLTTAVIERVRVQCEALLARGNFKASAMLKGQDPQSLIECFVVSKKDFVGAFQADPVDSFFNHFSFDMSSPAAVSGLPADTSPLDTTPLISLGGGRYYVSEPTRFPVTIGDSLVKKLCNSSYAEKYYKHRGKWVERKAAELLAKVFPRKDIYNGAYYQGDDGQRHEADILIPYQRRLLISEEKAKALRSPLHTDGNVARVVADFKASIQAAYDQALRTREFIKSRPSAAFVDEGGRALCTFSRDNFDEYAPFIVTAESYGRLATDLSPLLTKGASDPYPLVVSVFELELLVTRLNSPEKLFDYVQQRSRLHGLVHSHDELDYAGYYLRHGDLDFSHYLTQGDGVILHGGYAGIFDEDWYRRQGFDVGPSQMWPKPKPEFIEGPGERWVVLNPSRSKTMSEELINIPTPPTSKGRDRNRPCHCGSGKKTKHCCG